MGNLVKNVLMRSVKDGEHISEHGSDDKSPTCHLFNYSISQMWYFLYEALFSLILLLVLLEEINKLVNTRFQTFGKTIIKGTIICREVALHILIIIIF